jgi:RNA recognition motif-containing protein
MSKKLYVGGLSYSTTNNDLQTLFEDQGKVLSAVVITDRESGRSKGFGFVEMSSDQDASNAIAKLNGKHIDGRDIMVNEARERVPRTAVNSRW